MKTIFFLLFLLLLVACSIEEEKAQPGESFVTYIDSEGKDIAVQVTLPKEARYDTAPLVIPVSTFFTPQEPTFDKDITGVTDFGFVHITYLWPGKSNPPGAKSEGVYDYGGEDSLKALRDVIRFASGDIPNTNGKYIQELSALPLNTENLGLYAFSHPGIAATNVLALYADELDVKYFVGRENPTSDELYALELGYWDEKNNPVYFDANGNKELDAGDYVLSDKHPQMFGKLFYSRILLQALEENNAFDTIKRPENLATPELAEELWDFRETVFNYDKINKKIHVMLVFAEKDHVQSVKDKPHIHQAYDGFTNNNIWIRLNPDAVYASSMDASLTTPDNDANTEPKDWLEIESWAHTNKVPAAKRIPLAAIAEMADRVHTNNWDKNINELLI